MANTITVRRPIDPQPGQYEHVDRDTERGWHIWWQTVDRPGDVPYELYKPLWCPFNVGDDLVIDGDTLNVKEINVFEEGMWFWVLKCEVTRNG